jgi:hypothetical protein
MPTLSSPSFQVVRALANNRGLQRVRFPVSSAYHSPAITILQLLCFSRYFLLCLFITLFQAVSDGSYYREETRFYHLRRCEGSGQRAY